MRFQENMSEVRSKAACTIVSRWFGWDRSLARYTHRVAISNSRLLALDERGVTSAARINTATAGSGFAR